MNEPGVDPFVDDADLAPIAFGIKVALEFGRGLAPIGRFESQQVDRVARAGTQPVGLARRELGVEIEVAVGGPVEELEIAEQRDVGPTILDVENLAPAVVPDDEVRGEALAFEAGANLGDGDAVLDSGFELAHERMGAGRALGRGVDDLAHAVELPLALLGDEHHGVAEGGEMARGVDELRRKVLVDEKPVHRTRRRSGSYAAGLTACAHSAKPSRRSVTWAKPAAASWSCKVRAVKPVLCAMW